MRQVSFMGFFILLCVAAFWTMLPTGCANIIPPSGGPRDTLPPRLLSALPKDSTTNFRSNRITLTFDEYVDLQEVQNNLLFTPTFEVNPEVSVRSKTVTVRFRDSLLPNTTYTFNFGNAIRDVNENNALRNFVYTFSTGPVLDSLTFSGKVTLADNGKTDSTLIVMLHQNLSDSAVIKQRPTYIARVDAKGNFRFQHLPKGTFAIYALGEAGVVRRYQNKSQYFAFYNQPISTDTAKNIILFAYREQPAQNNQTSTTPTKSVTNATDRRLRFTASPSGNLDLQSDFVLSFPSPLRTFDSTKVLLSTDTTFTKVAFSALLDSSRTTIHIRSSWIDGTRYNLILNRDFAEDSAGRKLLKTDTLNFTTKKRSDYGRLRVRTRNVDLKQNPVLQFVQNDQVVFSVPIKTGVYTSTLFNPGEYQLRILYDANDNGKWDPGQFFGTKRQPEIVHPMSRNIVVKAGGENNFEASL